ncbi:hypothetical protein [Neobacillus piezotolerans]|nr:hypothetical protein [Neobacillus piezotolerans]
MKLTAVYFSGLVEPIGFVLSAYNLHEGKILAAVERGLTISGNTIR